MTCRRLALWLVLAGALGGGAPARPMSAQTAPAPQPALVRDTTPRSVASGAATSASRDTARRDSAQRDSAQRDSSASDAAKATATGIRRDSTATAGTARRDMLPVFGGYTAPQFITLIAVLAVVVMLALTAGRLFDGYAELLRKDDSLGVTSHWGGFGGGGSGWRASRALSMLLGGILVVAATTTLAVAVVDRVLTDGTSREKEKAAPPGAPGAPSAPGAPGAPSGKG